MTVIGNTADDETFFGLHVSPDLDTITYTLAGCVEGRQGWGVAGDSHECLAALQRFYTDTWFRLGDADLATHIFRTDALRRGASLSRVTADIAKRFGLRVTLLPMSDDPVRTMVRLSRIGWVPFQTYLVRRQGRGRVEAVRFKGIRRARPAPGVLEAIRRANFIIVPPSNPIVSTGPILALPGVRPAVRRRKVRTAAVSPIVRGIPIKGPLHRMLKGLGHEVSAVGVARLYRDFVDLFVIDERDANLAPRIADLGMKPLVTDTIMRTPARARALAATVLRELHAASQQNAPAAT